jgi:predicted flap endonuclease-1-like 5' DNA nuclease
MMEQFKTFWTDLFTAMNTEDSIAVLVFLGVSFLLGLLFGAWSRAGKIRRLKRELEQKETDLKSLRTQYDLLVEQFEKKEDDLKVSEARANEMSEDITRLTKERTHYQTELRSAREQLERLQEENLNYANQLAGIGEGGVIMDPNTVVGIDDNGNGLDGSTAMIDELQNDRLSLIEEKLEKLVLENANLKEEMVNLEKTALSSNPVIVGGGTVGGSTGVDIETGEEVLDLSEVPVVEVPDTFDKELLEEDFGEMSPQERGERAKVKIGELLGTKIPRANISEKDDLKKIEGIGPFIEMKLNDIGIYTFEKVSMLNEDAISLITDAIQFFPGRIEKDDWVGQAASYMG